MKSLLSVLATGAAVAIGVFALASLTNRSFVDAARATSEPDRIERGRYLVHGVGLCIDCHSPRNEKGEFLVEKHLTGSPVGAQPTVPMPWAPYAPRIAGLPAGFTFDETVHFLMTGERPQGRPAPLPPMPPYRMDRRDAEAVATYLRSLAPAK